jgi:hypothetical protein
LGGKFVEYAIYELKAIGATERLGELDGLVNRHPVRHFNVMHKLVAANQQNTMLNWG